MKMFFGTFGQTHTHRLGGVTLDCDSVIGIMAEDIVQARKEMFRLFGETWFTVYDSDKMNWGFFPRGLVKTVTAKGGGLNG